LAGKGSVAGAPGVEWKASKPLFGAPLELSQVCFRIARGKQWFEVEGEARTDAGRATLAALLEAARERRRWLSFGNGAHARIPDEVADRLRAFASLRGGGGELPLLSLGAIPLVEELAAQGAVFDADAEWTLLTERWAKAKELPITIPPGFESVLRDYQKEGFAWMSRLAAWNTGAVLADDMGLGKTVQSLALLASRASLGPALVVAPSSVLHTWKNETAKFAPGLQVHFFHESDRSLGGCGPGTVVVVSWSLFAREAKAFAAQRFATVVLDEAQAIKNGRTQRARATHGLQADFVLALSGTPVENHLGEAWSLFRTVVPGLLGSEESFRLRFGVGEEQAGVRALAQVVRPFILRRTKGEVAKELPPRTDLNLVVPLTEQERAIYEDVRLAATAELSAVTGEKRRFEMLAALTRLRLAACHPKLVDAGWKGPASKLTRLIELLEELRAAGHRVLVFSQFTSHLGLVRAALEQNEISFSYLDGHVPTDERQRRVEAFQSGRGGDVFLISLKAGGTGLTLTAADYVVHLDPWWNPAAEDQASDRAHRIGQTRPVTVYRLISEGTIEQKILSLHAEKRELVDVLLEGTDQVGKFSSEQLLELIRKE
jgi:SNF2 family DNA or RNA helicase